MEQTQSEKNTSSHPRRPTNSTDSTDVTSQQTTRRQPASNHSRAAKHQSDHMKTEMDPVPSRRRKRRQLAGTFRGTLIGVAQEGDCITQLHNRKYHNGTTEELQTRAVVTLLDLLMALYVLAPPPCHHVGCEPKLKTQS